MEVLRLGIPFVRQFLLTILITSIFIFCSPLQKAWAYNPPVGFNGSTTVADISQPRGHGTMGLKAIDVLRGDGLSTIANFFNTYRQEILNGELQPDTFGTPFAVSVPGVYTTPPLPGSSFSHFYNPATGKGLVLDFGKYNFAVDAAQFVSLGSWELYTLTGPQPGSNDMADWAYAQAVDEMRKGNTAKAVTWMGWVLHYVQDVTVPQHATDEGAQKPGSMHTEYENAVDTYLNSLPHATQGGIYRNDWRPGQYIEEAARRSTPLLSLAKNSATFYNSAQQMVPLAEQLGAGLLKRFYELWQSENFSVVILTIERVKAINTSWVWYYVDYPDQADFYPNITIGNSTLGSKAYGGSSIDGGDDVYPNKLLPFSWVFPKWINNRIATVPFDIKIYDEDGVTQDDYVDISPSSSRRNLLINYNANGQITGDVSVSGTVTKTSFNVTGDNTNTRAQVWMNLQRFPSL
ncbi:hypothetical protein [Nostoc sp. FACHB-280]|uniref:hypothetical protein n=1 Tax=Nostoc sp. FACHB-280 TaxID=2692839 RepID=UPI00168AA30E|nr:hypothetical protein [Nostoc sp. FACHB-280]MBD2498914.1 hypothetical protein [Nostoc sp. FACHB-280]